MPTALTPEVMNPNEAAKYLQLAPRTLDNWRSLGKGPPFSKVGHLIRYQKRTIDEWLLKRSQTKTKRNSTGAKRK